MAIASGKWSRPFTIKGRRGVYIKRLDHKYDNIFILSRKHYVK
jgi:hypothetical protein